MGSEDYPVAEETVSYIPMDPCFLGKTGRADKKRRFSEEQIKSLESMFECQAKLEPRKKLQLARELGLQPRQVAIWFQNKRARWKSKQLEQEFAALRADHDALLSSVESLKKEKQVLIKQLQKLSELLKKASDETSNNGDSENGDGGKDKGEEDVKPGRLAAAVEDCCRRVAACSDDEENKFGYVHHEEAELLYMGEPGSGYLTSLEQQCDFNCGCSSPEPGGATAASEWWEFWPLTEVNPAVSESI